MLVWIKNYLPITLLLLLAIAAYVSDITHYLSLEKLRLHHKDLLEWVNSNSLLAGLAFTTAYIFVGACSIPAGSFMILLAGFLFPSPLCILYSAIGATLGGCIIFSAARSAFGKLLNAIPSPALVRIEKGIQNNAWGYLIFLRLVPIFPFWIVNLAPAFFNVSLWTFFWTTALGFLPIIFVLTQIGSGLGEYLDNSEPLSFSTLFPIKVLIVLSMMGLCALALAIYNQRKNNSKAS